MKYLRFVLIIFIFFGCQEENKEHFISGTWKRCNKDGSYYEYKFTNKYLLMLDTNSGSVSIFGNKNIDKGIILFEFENGDNLLVNNDTLIAISKSKSKVILKSIHTYETYEFNKAKFEIDEIDSLNMEAWKNKIFDNFEKRAEIENCPDVRTEAEKNIEILDMDEFEEEEIPITEIIDE